MKRIVAGIVTIPFALLLIIRYLFTELVLGVWLEFLLEFLKESLIKRFFGSHGKEK